MLLCGRYDARIPGGKTELFYLLVGSGLLLRHLVSSFVCFQDDLCCYITLKKTLGQSILNPSGQNQIA